MTHCLLPLSVTVKMTSLRMKDILHNDALNYRHLIATMDINDNEPNDTQHLMLLF